MALSSFPPILSVGKVVRMHAGMAAADLVADVAMLRDDAKRHAKRIEESESRGK